MEDINEVDYEVESLSLSSVFRSREDLMEMWGWKENLKSFQCTDIVLEALECLIPNRMHAYP
jgi:hypothetical protein